MHRDDFDDKVARARRDGEQLRIMRARPPSRRGSYPYPGNWSNYMWSAEAWLVVQGWDPEQAVRRVMAEVAAAAVARRREAAAQRRAAQNDRVRDALRLAPEAGQGQDPPSAVEIIRDEHVRTFPSEAVREEWLRIEAQIVGDELRRLMSAAALEELTRDLGESWGHNGEAPESLRHAMRVLAWETVVDRMLRDASDAEWDAWLHYEESLLQDGLMACVDSAPAAQVTERSTGNS